MKDADLFLSDAQPAAAKTRAKSRTPVLLLLVSTVLPVAAIIFWACHLHASPASHRISLTQKRIVSHRPLGLLTDSRRQTPKRSTLLYASSYGGTVTTLNLTWRAAEKTDADSPSAYSLDVVSASDGCAPSPSWLTLDPGRSVLYCCDEGLSSNRGSVAAFQIGANGSLSLLDKVDTPLGPVSAAVYGDNGGGLAVAEYGGSSLSSLDVRDPSRLGTLQTETFSLAKPGPVPSRQEAPHPHEAIVDPTRRFLLVPDLGADLVRVFTIDKKSLKLNETEALKVAAGSGPRHARFLVTPYGTTFMYLAAELANTITGYRVSYDSNDVIQFEELFAIPTHGEGNQVPEGAAAAETVISPDGRFLIVSSRNESSLTVPDPEADGNAGHDVTSDPLITFTIDPRTGELSPLQVFPAGGSFPRQFSLNRDGTLLAVGLQQDGRAAVIRRDVETGELKEIVASARIEGQVTAVIFAGEGEGQGTQKQGTSQVR